LGIWGRAQILNPKSPNPQSLNPQAQTWPRPGRMILVAICALILCSCRGPHLAPGDSPGARFGQPTVPSPQPPVPYIPTGPWSPPGISQPWPEDEYLRDGGDAGLPARVDNLWEVHGLEIEDAVAHYDTLDGQTVVEPTNRVHIYSPRFGAVRQVRGLVANEQMHRAAGVHLPTTPLGPTATQPVTSSKQNVQADRQIGARPAVVFRSKQGDGVMSTANKAWGFQQDQFLPYENLKIIREGVLDGSDSAWLARGIDAAVAWTHKQAVQVFLDHQAATVEISDQSYQSVYTVKAPPGEPKLRVVKVASTQFAEPGDEVAFTIRFDNIGNQVIGNVTIIDNLSTRLEYIPDSAQSSVDAEFFTEPNEGDSLVIRCEIANPLQPGTGGVIRFRCRVR